LGKAGQVAEKRSALRICKLKGRMVAVAGIMETGFRGWM
jgi:hypothetical protein